LLQLFSIFLDVFCIWLWLGLPSFPFFFASWKKKKNLLLLLLEENDVQRKFGAPPPPHSCPYCYDVVSCQPRLVVVVVTVAAASFSAI
jgi:hypothetical protein